MKHSAVREIVDAALAAGVSKPRQIVVWAQQTLGKVISVPDVYAVKYYHYHALSRTGVEKMTLAAYQAGITDVSGIVQWAKEQYGREVKNATVACAVSQLRRRGELPQLITNRDIVIAAYHAGITDLSAIVQWAKAQYGREVKPAGVALAVCLLRRQGELPQLITNRDIVIAAYQAGLRSAPKVVRWAKARGWVISMVEAIRYLAAVKAKRLSAAPLVLPRSSPLNTRKSHRRSVSQQTLKAIILDAYATGLSETTEMLKWAEKQYGRKISYGSFRTTVWVMRVEGLLPPSRYRKRGKEQQRTMT